MIKWFKKYFVPHQDNDWKPHLFREASTAVLFFLIIVLFGTAVGGRYVLTHTDLTALILPRVLVDYANEDRATKKYNQLAINPVLEKAAQLKANDMADKGYFAHKSPDGKTPWYWFEQAGYDFSYAGENLAVNFNDSVDVNTAWMNSPGHRDNIMNNNFTEIGIATAQGFYQGRPTIFVVQLFGRPAVKEVVTAKPVATTTKLITTTKTKITNTTVSTASTAPVVLSESASSETVAENGTNELFIAVEKKSAVANTSSSKYSSFVEKIISSPYKFLSYVYMAIAIMLFLGIAATVFVELRRQHLRHILLAIGLLVIIVGLLYIYKAVLFSPIIVV